jgi:hypothetical protein
MSSDILETNAEADRFMTFAERLDRETQAVADRVQSKNGKYNRDAETSALILTKATNTPVSERMVLESYLFRIKVNKRALFADDDLVAFAQKLLDVAVPRRGSQPRRQRFLRERQAAT